MVKSACFQLPHPLSSQGSRKITKTLDSFRAKQRQGSIHPSPYATTTDPVTPPSPTLSRHPSDRLFDPSSDDTASLSLVSGFQLRQAQLALEGRRLLVLVPAERPQPAGGHVQAGEDASFMFSFFIFAVYLRSINLLQYSVFLIVMKSGSVEFEVIFSGRSRRGAEQTSPFTPRFFLCFWCVCVCVSEVCIRVSCWTFVVVVRLAGLHTRLMCALPASLQYDNISTTYNTPRPKPPRTFSQTAATTPTPTTANASSPPSPITIPSHKRSAIRLFHHPGGAGRHARGAAGPQHPE